MSEYVRVHDIDTGHIRSVQAAEAAHGNYEVLDEPALDPITGDVRPPVLAEPKAKATTKSGPVAEKKEN